MAGIRRGVNGTITSEANVRKSANHRKAADCCISSSTKPVSQSENLKRELVLLTFSIQLFNQDFDYGRKVNFDPLARMPD